MIRSPTRSTILHYTTLFRSIQWYDAATGGNLLAGTTALVDGTHYFASQTTTGCESVSRLDVAGTANTKPGAPTASATQTFCSSTSPTIANLVATGSNIQWYD